VGGAVKRGVTRAVGCCPVGARCPTCDGRSRGGRPPVSSLSRHRKRRGMVMADGLRGNWSWGSTVSPDTRVFFETGTRWFRGKARTRWSFVSSRGAGGSGAKAPRFGQTTFPFRDQDLPLQSELLAVHHQVDQARPNALRTMRRYPRQKQRDARSQPAPTIAPPRQPPP
jgi:hypothetical protein